ncbi:FecR domain-containing protein [Sphingorhabdus sp. YGSMI21]|uniref:FecR family protein n=1 Tax=Sphingorhabdus sp. YGSMI21 TaxID=2077182 RepID=UPI000C1EBAC5|nr:FecR domain-containing protein [Sphingorhabdus sp. YGSMI21]ATW03837.1 iron dicitrate transport regulator FecR [Sphingorhabdus sp. YGSMI21]
MSDGTPFAVEAEALDWIIRQRDPAFDDWEGFTEWLELSPGHSAIYDRMAAIDAEPGDLPEPVEEISVARQPVLASRRTWLGGAMAAALVGIIGFTLLDSGATHIETAAGEQRTVALADGSRIEINGGSVIELDEDRPRFARIESGEAMFHVVHREGDPFLVEAGKARLVDMGTAFNVIRRRDGLTVAVSEGLVLYNPQRENVRLDAGFGIEASDAGGPPQVQAIDVFSVGSWRKGQLVYNGTSIAQVAEDLGRTTGLTINVSPDVASLPFRGALLISDDRQRVIDDLTALAGIRAEKQDEGWLLTR